MVMGIAARLSETVIPDPDRESREWIFRFDWILGSSLRMTDFYYFSRFLGSLSP